MQKNPKTFNILYQEPKKNKLPRTHIVNVYDLIIHKPCYIPGKIATHTTRDGAGWKNKNKQHICVHSGIFFHTSTMRLWVKHVFIRLIKTYWVI